MDFNEEEHGRFRDMVNNRKVKMRCPNCSIVQDISRELAEADGAKCGVCFKKKQLFINLVLTKFERNKL